MSAPARSPAAMRVQASANGADKPVHPVRRQGRGLFQRAGGVAGLHPVDHQHELGDGIARIELQHLRRERLARSKWPTQTSIRKVRLISSGASGSARDRLFVASRRRRKSRDLLGMAAGQIDAEQMLLGGGLRRCIGAGVAAVARRGRRTASSAAISRRRRQSPTRSRSTRLLALAPAYRTRPVTCSGNWARRRPRVQPNRCFAPGP